jgi:uncharacterized RDD family membrane protein YckC
MRTISLSDRFKSIFFDQVFLSVLGGVTNVITRLMMEESNVDMTRATTEGSVYFTAWTALLICLYLNKDIFSGRSIGKRMTGLQITENIAEGPPGPLRCLVRNFFSLLWPLELVVLLFNPGRRVGDFVAGTRVVPTIDNYEWTNRTSESKA